MLTPHIYSTPMYSKCKGFYKVPVDSEKGLKTYTKTLPKQGLGILPSK